MKQKYEKPLAKNLGEVLPNAEGYCISIGNSANIPFPEPNCTPGEYARGAVCADGGIPSQYACQNGTKPVNFGCLPGLSAVGTCTATGASVTP